jgi:plasmid maintenance system antidote protein VapI
VKGAASAVPAKPLAFWQVLDLLRARANISSQRALSIELGISEQYLSDILAGRRNISANLAARLNLRKEITELYWPVDPEAKP